jgi:UDP-N-acetyl-D-mannosaminouronate:lipid I N-acetyl-D-mannosaminouronosyltransferase
METGLRYQTNLQDDARRSVARTAPRWGPTLRSMSPPDLQPSPLHVAASGAFPHASLRGLTTFAPPRETALLELLATGPGVLLAVNAVKVANADPTIVAMTETHLGFPDGIGAVLALRRLGIPATRLAGADLWLRVLDRYAQERSFYLVGGTKEVVGIVAEKLLLRHPGLQLHYRDGYLAPGDRERLHEDLRTTRPDFVFVAMGSPRQEILMASLYEAHPAVYLGLGGSFDVFAERKRRAPRRVRQLGLEWAYRLIREPGRIRQLPAIIRFAVLLVTGRF